MINC
jgi:hypothetical protein